MRYIVRIVSQGGEQYPKCNKNEGTIKHWKANWSGHILRRNCLLKHFIEEMTKKRKGVTRRRGKRSKQLLDYLKQTRGYWKLKEEAIDGSLWRTGFGRGCGTDVRQTAELSQINEKYVSGAVSASVIREKEENTTFSPLPGVLPAVVATHRACNMNGTT